MNKDFKTELIVLFEDINAKAYTTPCPHEHCPYFASSIVCEQCRAIEEIDDLMMKQIDLHEECSGLKKAKQDVAKQILDEVDDKLNDLALEYYNTGHPTYYAVCEVIHHKVISPILKKYIKNCTTCKHLVYCEPNTSGNFDCWEGATE